MFLRATMQSHGPRFIFRSNISRSGQSASATLQRHFPCLKETYLWLFLFLYLHNLPLLLFTRHEFDRHCVARLRLMLPSLSSQLSLINNTRVTDGLVPRPAISWLQQYGEDELLFTSGTTSEELIPKGTSRVQESADAGTALLESLYFFLNKFRTLSASAFSAETMALNSDSSFSIRFFSLTTALFTLGGFLMSTLFFSFGSGPTSSSSSS